jgi:hypothetical protein
MAPGGFQDALDVQVDARIVPGRIVDRDRPEGAREDLLGLGPVLRIEGRGALEGAGSRARPVPRPRLIINLTVRLPDHPAPRSARVPAGGRLHPDLVHVIAAGQLAFDDLAGTLDGVGVVDALAFAADPAPGSSAWMVRDAGAAREDTDAPVVTGSWGRWASLFRRVSRPPSRPAGHSRLVRRPGYHQESTLRPRGKQGVDPARRHRRFRGSRTSRQPPADAASAARARAKALVARPRQSVSRSRVIRDSDR